MQVNESQKKYRLLLYSTSVIFFVGYAFTIYIFVSVTNDSGNGGAFYFGFGILSFFITAPLVFVLGIFTFIYRYVARSRIQDSILYSYWIPLAMAFTPCLLPLHSFLKYDLKLLG